MPAQIHKVQPRRDVPKARARPKVPHSPIIAEPHSSWFLRKTFGFCESLLLLNSSTSITGVLLRLEKARADNCPNSPINVICRTPEAKTKMIATCITLAVANQRRLMAFRALARRWLVLRVKPANEDDLVTGEIPKRPVVVMSWPDRRTYHFEAATIRQDMTTRILQHNYLFAKFSAPRNPYTNVNLTQSQFFSIMKQLREYGMTNWILEGLYSMHYSMLKFRVRFGDAVKREIIDRQFKAPKSEETIDILMEFIADQHEVHEKHFNHCVYMWALRNLQEMPVRMQFWLKTCKQYHLASATMLDRDQMSDEIDRIEALTKRYCGVPHDLIARREIQHKLDLLKKNKTQEDLELEQLENLITAFSLHNINTA